jgi:hypothetical protein
MRKLLFSFAVLILAGGTAHALRIAPSPVNLRVAHSSSVVVGKVTGFEARTVKAPRYPGDKEQGEYRIAVVKIEDGILGVKGLTHIKVGVLVPPPAPPIDPTQPSTSRGFQSPKLDQGEEYLLFLSPNEGGKFVSPVNYFDVVPKKGGEFAGAVKEARAAATLLADPMAGLKAKDAKTRFETAGLLVMKYRYTRNGQAKQEAIPAEESKLILGAIADADWKAQARRPFEITPISAFQQLQLTPADGWTQPRNFQEFPAAARAWLKKNAGSYRLKKFVPTGLPK